jgi:hypothetical protein
MSEAGAQAPTATQAVIREYTAARVLDTRAVTAFIESLR